MFIYIFLKGYKMRRILKTLIATGFLMLSAFSIQAFATNSATLVNTSGEYRPSESVRLHSALITNNKSRNKW